MRQIFGWIILAVSCCLTALTLLAPMPSMPDFPDIVNPSNLSFVKFLDEFSIVFLMAGYFCYPSQPRNMARHIFRWSTLVLILICLARVVYLIFRYPASMNPDYAFIDSFDPAVMIVGVLAG